VGNFRSAFIIFFFVREIEIWREDRNKGGKQTKFLRKMGFENYSFGKENQVGHLGKTSIF